MEHVWAYVRGDVSDRDFRSLIKATENAEPVLGSALYMAIWAPDLDAHDSVEDLKDALLTFARAQSRSTCRCRELSYLAKVDWSVSPESGEDPMAVMNTLMEVRARGRPTRWVRAYRCTGCGQWWLVAEDHSADAYYLRRMGGDEASALMIENRWPSEFETASAMQAAFDTARVVPVRFARGEP